jgi:hypothetical protein
MNRYSLAYGAFDTTVTLVYCNSKQPTSKTMPIGYNCVHDYPVTRLLISCVLRGSVTSRVHWIIRVPS